MKSQTMKLRTLLATAAAVLVMGTLPAMASTILLPISLEEGTSWVAGTDQGNGWFMIMNPPSSNDALAFQAVGLDGTQPIIVDDHSGSGTTSPGFDGMGNGDTEFSWWSSTLPQAVAIKAGSAWYLVVSTVNAEFDAATGMWHDTITHEASPQGSLSHTAALVPIPAAVWLMGSALLGLGAVRRRKSTI